MYKLNSILELIRVWTYRIIRSRYRQSVLGGLWAVIQPASSAVVLSVIFVHFVAVDTGKVPYILFSYGAMVPWTLFSTSIADMVECLVGNMNLISKIYFPREVLPISSLFARVFDFLIAGIILLVLMYVYKVPIYVQGILFYPLLLVIQMIFSLGIGFLGATLNVFYRDIRSIFVLGLQIWFYVTPIIYPASSVPEKYLSIYYLNPMVGIITAYRSILFEHTLPGSYLIYSAAIACVTLVAGFWLFKKLEFQFADVV